MAPSDTSSGDELDVPTAADGRIDDDVLLLPYAPVIRRVVLRLVRDSVQRRTGAVFQAFRQNRAESLIEKAPFDGCEYGTFAYIDTVLLLNEAHASERVRQGPRVCLFCAAPALGRDIHA